MNCAVCALIYALGIVGIFAWAVFVEGRSGWWFLLALILISNFDCKQTNS